MRREDAHWQVLSTDPMQANPNRWALFHDDMLSRSRCDTPTRIFCGRILLNRSYHLRMRGYRGDAERGKLDPRRDGEWKWSEGLWLCNCCCLCPGKGWGSIYCTTEVSGMRGHIRGIQSHHHCVYGLKECYFGAWEGGCILAKDSDSIFECQ